MNCDEPEISARHASWRRDRENGAKLGGVEAFGTERGAERRVEGILWLAAARGRLNGNESRENGVAAALCSRNAQRSARGTRAAGWHGLEVCGSGFTMPA